LRRSRGGGVSTGRQPHGIGNIVGGTRENRASTRNSRIDTLLSERAGATRIIIVRCSSS